MKLLVDMNLSPVWAQVLSDEGFPSQHWSLVGPATASDKEIMDWASTHDHVVITHDLDFAAILALTRGLRPSVVQIRSANLDSGVIGSQVIAALRQMGAELEAGALLTIDPARIRIRVLPLSREDSK